MIIFIYLVLEILLKFSIKKHVFLRWLRNWRKVCGEQDLRKIKKIQTRLQMAAIFQVENFCTNTTSINCTIQINGIQVGKKIRLKRLFWRITWKKTMTKNVCWFLFCDILCALSIHNQIMNWLARHRIVWTMQKILNSF